ncbi:hypothetical protein M595_5593 [Lyngbya aestuarii BL J]|uniref:Uncharacterized protein n=1 Tax=Lyngbya aestuarii BL J TaxID=1348334 RepID=U7Q9I1_9CYAN|nr:hypothetical protein M595_5593 [Lyngbya aestuarii BL J]
MTNYQLSIINLPHLPISPSPHLPIAYYTSPTSATSVAT